MRPLIAICGTTGVGKSKLGIELAVRLTKNTQREARIINADSMQVYAGMDILTNKVPAAERQGVEHLLMGFKQPGEQYVVGQWVQDAVAAIEETHLRNQIPIVVGGTAYWIQHLLFPGRLLSSAPVLTEKSAQGSPPLSNEVAESISTLPPHLLECFESLPEQPPSASANPEAALSLHGLLTILDPIVAARWHWRDTRKVLRSLRIIKESGRRASDIFIDQSQFNLTPRYPTLCFWLYADPSVLYSRLDARVEEMIEQGVLEEIGHLREMATSPSAESVVPSDAGSNSNEGTADHTLGVYQSIGYREFDQYLASSTQSEESLRHAIERMKQSTRQYAKRQIVWIRNKLLPAVYAANSEKMMIPIYLLDATELGNRWYSDVLNLAETITQGFLGGGELPDPLELSQVARKMLTVDNKPIDPISVLAARQKLICPVCTIKGDRPVMVEVVGWEAHQRARLHRRLAKKKRRDETGDKRLQSSEFPMSSLTVENQKIGLSLFQEDP